MSFPYNITRSKRKTLALHIRGGALEIRAPHNLPKSEIERFVKSKEKWVREKLAQSNERREKRNRFRLDYGASILYRGRLCKIVPKEGNRVGYANEEFYMPPDLAPEEIKHACIQIYRMLAKNVLVEKVADFAKVMSVSPTAVKINGATTRWGSCSSRKSLNFSWRLIMAADDVIDYVVVHELAHITEMNHSEGFWAIVENILPDYGDRRAKLKELQQRLSVEDWE